MKSYNLYILLTVLLSLLISVKIISGEKSGKNEFLKEEIEDLFMKDKERYLAIQQAMVKLEMDFEKSNLSAHHQEIRLALNDAGGIYKKITHTMIGSCSYNRAICNHLKDHSELDRYLKTLTESAKWEMIDHAKSLMIVIEQTMNETVKAHEYFDWMMNTLGGISTILDEFERNFEALITEKIDRLTEGTKVKCAHRMFGKCVWHDYDSLTETAKNNLVSTKNQTEEFLKDFKNYAEWLKQFVSELMDKLTPVDDDGIKSLLETTQGKMPLLKEVNNYLFDQSKNLEKKKLIRYSDDVNAAVQDICNKCSYFANLS